MRYALLPSLSLWMSCNEVNLQTLDCPAEAASVYYEDLDGDGYGVLERTVIACEPPAGSTKQPGDCDDDNAQINPEGVDTCDGVDANCDGVVLPGDGPVPWHPDRDGDGFGDPTADVTESCEAPADHVEDASDCDDDNDEIYPAAPERCDDIDWDCDGSPHTQAGAPTTCGVLLVDPSDFYGIDLVEEEVLAAGASAYEKRAELPATLGSYELVILYFYTEPFTPQQVQLLADYHLGGGKLVLATEWSGFSQTAVANTQAVIDHLGYETTMLDASIDATCDTWQAQAAVHPLTSGASQIAYGFSGDMTPAGSAVGLYQGVSGQWLVIEDNGLILMSDGQVLDPCPDEDDSGNRVFVRNLVQWVR